MWKYTSYLKKGLSHEKAGTKCQDSVLIKEDAHCIVAALADGLGSLRYSDVAASTATHAVCELFASLGNKKVTEGDAEWKLGFARDIVERVSWQIHAQAAALGVAPDTMDCTLVFVYISKDHNYAITGRLGDSAICVISQDESLAINDGNHSANGTSAILDTDAYRHMEISFWNLNAQKIYGFMLTSDGLDNEIYRKGSTHVNKVAEGYFNAVALSGDPQSVIQGRVAELTQDPDSAFDDDISVAVISRATAAVVFPEDPTWLCTCGARNRLQDTYCYKCGKDFSVLYQNIRFKEHGGKAAFFQKINKNPREEASVIGLTASNVQPKAPVNPPKKPVSVSNDPGNVRTQEPVVLPADPAPSSQVPQQKSSAGKFVPLMLGLAAAGLVIGILFGSLFAKIGPNREIRKLKAKVEELKEQIAELQEEKEEVPPTSAPTEDIADPTEEVPTTDEPTEGTEPSQDPTEQEDPTEQTDSTDPTDPKNPTQDTPADTLPENILWDETGVYYWGEIKDGQPHGQGISLNGDYYYIGHFEKGQKEGTFLIVSVQYPDQTLEVTWKDGKIILKDSDLETHTVTARTLKLHSQPDEKSQVLAQLKEKDTVYKTDTDPVMKGTQKWVEVIHGDTVGWVLLDSIEPQKK